MTKLIEAAETRVLGCPSPLVMRKVGQNVRKDKSSRTYFGPRRGTKSSNQQILFELFVLLCGRKDLVLRQLACV